MNYRKEIDGLRAVAVLPVIFFHAGFQAFSGGFVGVDVFFVISGYLITSIIINEKRAGTFTIRGFYERRARRILPALFFVMLVCLPFAWLWLLPEDLKQFSRSVVAVSVFSSNVFFFLKAGYFDTASEFKPLLHTWSLAVEEQYYVFFPPFLLAIWRFGISRITAICIAIVLASLGIAQWCSIQYPAFAFYLLPARLWEILLGAVVAMLLCGKENERVERWRSHSTLAEAASFTGVALIGYAMFSFDRGTPFPGLYALFPTIGTVLIILFATPTTLTGRLLGSKWLVGIGVISYSAYLWHQPLFAFARHRSLIEPSNTLFITLSLTALALAYLSWKYVEAPFRRSGALTRQQIFSLSITCIAAFLALGVAGGINGIPSRFNPRVVKVTKVAKDRRERSPECAASYAKTNILQEACTLGATTHPVGVLVGDSHADAIATALGESLAARGMEVKDLSQPGCSPSVGLVRKNSDSGDCFAYNTEVSDEVLRDDKLEYVIIVARWTLGLDGNGKNLDHSGKSGNGFDNGEGGVEVLWRPKDNVFRSMADLLEERRLNRQRHVEMVRHYLEANKKVILVYPIPETGWDVPSYLAKKMVFDSPELNPADGSTSYEVYKKRNQEIRETFDSIGENRNLIRISPDRLLCNSYVAGRCVTQIAGSPLYFDDDHLSHSGAKLVADEIVKHIGNESKGMYAGHHAGAQPAGT